MDDAACRGMDVNVFFPEDADYDSRAYALLTCAGCHVRAECARFGAGEPTGIWGGNTGRYRRKHAGRIPERVPAIGSTRRLRALAVHGFGLTEIARRLNDPDLTRNHLDSIRDGRPIFVGVEQAKAIQRVYRLMCSWHSTHVGAKAVKNNAYANGWPAPEAWIGINMDDPNAGPRQVAA